MTSVFTRATPTFYRERGDTWIVPVRATLNGAPFDPAASSLKVYADLYLAYVAAPVATLAPARLTAPVPGLLTFIADAAITANAQPDGALISAALGTRIHVRSVDRFGAKRTAGIFGIAVIDPRSEMPLPLAYVDAEAAVTLPDDLGLVVDAAPVGMLGYARAGALVTGLD